jgi:hypothetical protein
MKFLRATVLLGLFAILLAGAKDRRKLWELDLSTFANRDGEMSAQVWGIRFSPDESEVAIGFGPRWNFESNPRHIVVVAVNQPRVVLRTFDLKIGSPFPSTGNIAWSPSGSTIVTRKPPIMLRFGTEPPCVFPADSEFGGFLSGDRMIIVQRDRGEIRIVASDCSVGDRWEVDPPADVLDTSPDKGLIAIQRFGKDTSRSAIEVIDASSHAVKQSWKWDSMSTFRGGFLFADHGKLACSANFPQGKQGPDVACWDIQTGSLVAENDKVAVDWHGINGAGNGLLAITDYKYISHQGKLWAFLDINNDYSVPQRHIIWNIRTGEEVTSWGRFGNFYQTELWGRNFEHTSKTKTPTVLSLSPTGKYVAEGGSGSVSVHALEP